MKKKTVITTEMHEVWVIRQEPLETEIAEADLNSSPPIQESFLAIRNDEGEDLTTDQNKNH